MAAAAMSVHRAIFPLRLQQILAGSRAVSPAIKVESELIFPLRPSQLPHLRAHVLSPYMMIPARNTRIDGAKIFKLCQPVDFQKAYRARMTWMDRFSRCLSHKLLSSTEKAVMVSCPVPTKMDQEEWRPEES